MQQAIDQSDYGSTEAAESSAFQVRWNDDRLDGLLSNISSLRPLVRTGLPTLDRLLCGGYCSGVHLLSAVPACGKSTLAAQIGDYNARFGSRRTVYLSCEMSAVSLILKSLSRMSAEADDRPLSYGEILSLSHRLGTTDDPRVSLMLETIERYRIEVAPRVSTIDEGLSIDGVARILEALADDPPFVILDYLQIVKCEGDYMSDYSALTAAMRRICELAKDYRTPILAIASQNRTGKRGTADMTSLSGSGELEYACTSAAFLTSGEDEPGKQQCRTVQLTLSKNKYGPTGGFGMRFSPAIAQFAEIDTGRSDAQTR